MGHGGHVIRIRYGKQGAGKYISHLDTIRAAERALRRLGLPLLYSEGFNPRPRMSFAAALQVGVRSVAEYMDVFLTEPIDPEGVVERGSEAFPEAMPIIAAGAFDGSYTLPSKVAQATYSIRPYGVCGQCWSETELEGALSRLMAMENVAIADKDGKEKQVRALINEVRAMPGELIVKLACGNSNLRPQGFMAALKQASGADYGVSQDICRVGLELELGSGPQDPLAGCAGNYYSNKFRS